MYIHASEILLCTGYYIVAHIVGHRTTHTFTGHQDVRTFYTTLLPRGHVLSLPSHRPLLQYRKQERVAPLAAFISYSRRRPPHLALSGISRDGSNHTLHHAAHLKIAMNQRMHHHIVSSPRLVVWGVLVRLPIEAISANEEPRARLARDGVVRPPCSVQHFRPAIP